MVAHCLSVMKEQDTCTANSVGAIATASRSEYQGEPIRGRVGGTSEAECIDLQGHFVF